MKKTGYAIAIALIATCLLFWSCEPEQRYLFLDDVHVAVGDHLAGTPQSIMCTVRSNFDPSEDQYYVAWTRIDPEGNELDPVITSNTYYAELSFPSPGLWQVDALLYFEDSDAVGNKISFTISIE